MYLDADELRPCRACGAPCDGDVCDMFCEAVLDAMQDKDAPAEDEDDEPCS
jgi:hypothetical protein